MYTFNEGDTVQANCTAQGLVHGMMYVVTKAHTVRSTGWGSYTAYNVRPEEGGREVLNVVNGHLLLSKVN